MDMTLIKDQLSMQKYLNKRYRFFCKIFNKKEISKLPKFDYIILFGILHHLNNDEVNSILNLCKKIMKKNCKITEDRILIKNQNMIAALIQKDRE